MEKFKVKFCFAVISEKSVLLLFNVGELGIAKTEHLVVVQQSIGKALKTSLKFRLGCGSITITPAYLMVVLFVLSVRPFKPRLRS